MTNHAAVSATRSINAFTRATQRFLTPLLAIASAVFLGVMLLPAPAMAQTCAQTFDELVLTDMQGYEPGETVHITGSGFAPGCNLTVQITAPMGP